MPLAVRRVQCREQIEIGRVMVALTPVGRLQIENRRAFRPQRRALIRRRQKTVAPIRRATLRIRHFRQHDEARQIFVRRAEAVGHPRTDRRIAAEAIAGVHLIHRGRMIHGIDLAAAIETDVVDDFGEVLPILGHVGAALAGLAELERTLHVVAFAALHRRLMFPLRTNSFR